MVRILHLPPRVDQAYQRMRRHARSNNAGLRVVAETIVAVGPQV
jgi:AmiR/NasT family two-component response regulator